jgi:hypothetical protein
MDWTQLAPEFEWDGMLRDIYVVGTNVDDWQRVLDALDRIEPRPSLLVNGQPARLPTHAASLFEIRSTASPLLTADVGGVHINCHFFGDNEIEFDLDPREVTGPAQIDAVSGFMKLLAQTTGKMAILTYENAKEEIILSVTPEL